MAWMWWFGYIYTVYVFSLYRLQDVDVCVWFWCDGELDVGWVVGGDRGE